MRTQWFLVGAFLTTLVWSGNAFAQGVIAPGAGPVNRAMGGVSTATAFDPIGANYWNPAAISSLENNAMGFGTELIIPDIHLGSTLPAGTILGLFPATTRSGYTRSDSGLSPAPSLGLVWRPETLSRLTLGAGITTPLLGIVNFPGDPGNPVLNPNNPPSTFGVGPVSAILAMFGSTVNAAYDVTDKLTIGVGGTATNTLASMDPAFFTGQNDANGDGFKNFAAATHSHPFWGGGFQLGAVYHLNQDWDFGFSYKSTIFQEQWTWRSSNEIGLPLNGRLKINTPNIYSWGVAYKGIERTVLAMDVRYLDYANSGLFGQRIIDGGLGWRSIFAIALGGQHRLTDQLSVQMGYIYNQNPIPGAGTQFNIQVPLIIQHTISAGASYSFNDYISMNLSYVHGFQNTIQGTMLQIPGTTVTMDTEYDSIVLGMTIKFGPPRRRWQAPCGTASAEVDTTNWAHTPVDLQHTADFMPKDSQ